MNAPVYRWAWMCVFLSCLRLHAQTPAPPITSTLAVQQLSPTAAAARLPVKIRGVVTFSQPWWHLVFVQDETGGVFCEPAGLVNFPPAGHLVEVEGSSSPGAHRPVVTVESITDWGQGQLPPSQPATAAQLWNGEFDGDLVEVRGHVASALTRNSPVPFLDLRLISDGRMIQATVLGLSNLPPATLLGSHVAVQGVHRPRSNDQKTISGVDLFSARPGMFRVISNANDIATTLSPQTVSDLQNGTNQLLRVRGVVAIGGTNDFWLADARGGINVILVSPHDIKRGDELEMLAIQNQDGRESRLSLLQILTSRPGTIPPAETLSVEELFDPHRHGQIVQTEGEFLHRIANSSGDILVFREGGRSFEARLRFDSEPSVRMLAAGTPVRLTGVLRMKTADAGLGASPRLLIHQPSDLEIMSPAPLSAEKLYAIASTLAALLAAGIVALGIAHRRLKDSTRRLAATENDLRNLNVDLERRISTRTAELEHINSQLGREIAERKTTEQTLAENEKKYRLLVEQIDTTVWEYDPAQDRMLYVSPQAARFGYALEDWLQPGFWKDHIHPDDRAFAINFCATETTKGLNHELQYRFNQADGTTVWLDDKVAVETRRDGSRLLRGVVIDITAQKQREEALRQSEERFARAFHASPSIVVIVRKSTARYIDVNERFIQVMGYSREEIIGRTSMELGIWTAPNQRREIMDALDAGQTIRNVECVFRTKSGARHTMLLSIETIVLDGEPCLLGINNDITDLKKAESLREAQNLILEKIAQGAPLSDTLTELVSAVEAQAEGMLCSILLLSTDGRHLRNGAAPSLPDVYNRQIDGLAIGPQAGSCGTAAHFGQPVLVEDILTDPRWAPFRDAAQPHGLRSCWSTPIFDAQHRLLGTFATYHKTPGCPTEEHLRLIQTATHTAAICIRRARDEESLQESREALRRQNALLNEMEELAQIGAWSHGVDTDAVICSDQIYRIYELPLAHELSVEQAMSHYPPDARPSIAAAVENAGRTGAPWDLELPFITAKANHRWVRVQGKAELSAGRPVRLHGSFQDITHRRRIEESLRSSEERFAKAFQLSPAITVITRRSDGRYLDLNARFTEIMGYSREEALGRTSMELGLWASTEKSAPLLETLERHGHARDIECEYIDKSGRTHVMITSAEPIHIAGEPCLLLVNHDISDRRRIENGLRSLVTCINAASTTDFHFKLAQQLSQLFHARYALVAALLPNRPDAMKTLGVSADGKPVENFEKHLPGSPCAEALSQQIHFVPRDVTRLYPGDATLADFKIESYLAIRIPDSQRQPLGIVAVFHDQPWNPPPEYEMILRLFAESAGVQLERNRSFAALQLAESRFRMAIEHSFDCLALTNAGGLCTYISPAVTRILGYAVEELSGHPASQIVLPEDLGTYLTHQEFLKRNTGTHAELEYRVRHRNGSTRWIQSADTNRLDDPDLRAIVRNFRDITERKHAELIQGKLEVQLRQSQKMEAIGTLAGGVAHDFNNILGAIIGCAELARMDSINNPDALANLDDLLKASHRAKDLVKQILAFSRREEYQRKVIPLEPIVSESLRLLRATLKPSIELRSFLAAPLPDVLVDPTMIQQVLINLVTNAAQAIGDRPGLVEIHVREHTEDPAPELRHPRAHGHPQVLIQVRDNGCGMDSDLLGRIFEPFFTTKGPGQGTGLGLSVVHGIISAHGGVIRVESSPGKGTTFAILLPAATGSRTATPEPARPSAPLPGGHERILLVDDERSLLAVSEKVLRRVGYQVTACNDSSSALVLFRNTPDDFDLVITDYSMPGQSGTDLAREMFALRPRLPVIVCTGYTTGLTADQALQMGFSEFLHKPLVLDQLCAAIRRVLDNQAPAHPQP